jgi:hypothetical protein
MICLCLASARTSKSLISIHSNTYEYFLPYFKANRAVFGRRIHTNILCIWPSSLVLLSSLMLTTIMAEWPRFEVEDMVNQPFRGTDPGSNQAGAGISS